MWWLTGTDENVFSSLLLTLFIGSLIITVCICGDHLLALSSVSDWSGYSPVIRALIDNSTHALIGALVWAFVENTWLLSDWKRWMKCIFCAFLAASVDADHFLAAGAVDLQKALYLPRRPPFHNTSLLIVTVILFWTLRYCRPGMETFSLMFLASWLSHHLRDANHRGLWLYPFGHTPVFPSYVYITLILILALIIRIVYHYVNRTTRLKDAPVSIV